jgi:hypothetical protein
MTGFEPHAVAPYPTYEDLPRRLDALAEIGIALGASHVKVQGPATQMADVVEGPHVSIGMGAPLRRINNNRSSPIRIWRLRRLTIGAALEVGQADLWKV